MSNTSRGLNGERRVWRALEDAGYLVASRRHIGGAGDLLARAERWRVVEADDGLPMIVETRRDDLLIEVKTDKAGPFATFSPADRKALLETADEYGCESLLAWTPSASMIFYIPEDEWPS